MGQSASMDKQDSVTRFARNAVRVDYASLPGDVVDITKKAILDTIGVALAASGIAPETRTLVEMMREIGGKEESTVLGFGGKIPSWHAGFVNGAMAHNLDYDDMHAGAGHVHAPIVPAALATAERLGGVSGKELIAAVALGSDMLCRLSITLRAARRGKEWYVPTVAGGFSSTLACSKLLKLTDEQTANALGIAFIHASGTMELVYSADSNIRGISHCMPGEVGVRSALMAQKGITGVKNCFEAGTGFMNAYFGGGYDASALSGELGERFPIRDHGFKQWPACAMTHLYIDATLQLVKEHNIQPDDIEQITVVVGDFVNKLCEPPEMRQHPATTMIAKWSVPYTVGVAVARRKVVISDFMEAALKDAAVLRIAERVKNKLNADYNQKPNVLAPPGEVEIKTKDNRTYLRKLEVAYGHPRNPMSWEDLAAKFRDCASYSAKPITRRKVDDLIDTLSNLEKVKDIGSVIRLLP